MTDRRRERRGHENRFLIGGLLLTVATVLSPVPALGDGTGSFPAEPTSVVPISVPSQGAVQVGSEAPDISLESIDGEASSLSAMRGDKNVILVFFRGTW